MEEALRASQASFRQLADSMPHMVWTARPDGYLDYYNERWYEFTGFSREDSGENLWKRIVHPDDLQRVGEAWREALKSGNPYTIECRLWDQTEKRWRWFLGRALPIRDAEGNVAKWFGSSTDIDDQKRTEDDLRRANADLEQFAFSATHDLQEPLRAIKIYSELLTKTCGPAIQGEGQQFLGHLRGGASLMEMLVRDLLSYTKVSQFERPEDYADAGEALNSALANLSSAIQEVEAEITSDPLPSVRLHEAHVQQLFQNLIGNAIKYRSPDMRPRVHVSADRQGNEWVFAISDNGIGIAPDYSETIFGLFKRLHTNDEYSGTGIGLAICRRIVERSNGRIWVESEAGKGSTFRFSIPI
jgi:PAS domain S-box-containing protein